MKRYIKISSSPDHESGDLYVDPDTGEVFQPQSGEYIITSIDSLQARAASAKRYQRIEAERQSPAYGDFCWLRVAPGFLQEISAADAARLLYLATFMGYDNRLYAAGVPIHQSKLSQLLHIRPYQARDFLTAAKPYLISDPDNDSCLYLQGDIFHRGELKSSAVAAALQDGAQFYRMYYSPVRNMYEAGDGAQYKFLRLLRDILPLLHPTRNIICNMSPAAEALSSWRQFCIALGRDPSNVSRDKKFFTELTVPTSTGVESVFACSDDQIYLNPRIVFGGTRVEDLEIHYLFANGKVIESKARAPTKTSAYKFTESKLPTIKQQKGKKNHYAENRLEPIEQVPAL